MTPAREKLLRLALEMPEQGVASITNSILWICPGLADKAKPMLVQNKVGLLKALGTIIHDPVLLERFQSELELLKAGHVPKAPKHDNVVALFAGRVSS
jgi:hypothetical protein